MTVTRKRLLILAVLACMGASACASPKSRREESLRRAEEAAVNGDLDRAAEILRTALGFDPRDRLVVARLARVYEERRAYGQALRLIEGYPDEVHERRWVNLRARLLLRCGRIAEGGRLSAALARQGEAEEETFETLSEIVLRQGLGPERTGDLPGSWMRRLSGRLIDAGEAGAAVLWLEQLPPVADLGADLLAQRLAAVALDSDDRSLVRRIHSLVAHADAPLALLVHRRELVLSGNEPEVARFDERFLRSFPNDPWRGDILESEGRRHLARGNLEEALSLADQALALDGSRIGALIVRGLALEWSGRIEEGRAALRVALALEPDNRVAREALRSTQGPESLIMRIEALER